MYFVVVLCVPFSHRPFVLFFFFLMIRRPPRSTLFPSRRSSDLAVRRTDVFHYLYFLRAVQHRHPDRRTEDRKSTRLNSSHTVISYAVFCLKKKTEKSMPCTTKRSSHQIHSISQSAITAQRLGTL